MACRCPTSSSSKAVASLVCGHAFPVAPAHQALRSLASSSASAANRRQDRRQALSPQGPRPFSTFPARAFEPRRAWSPRREPSLRPISPMENAKEMQEWFTDHYPESLRLPNYTFVQAITHESYDHGEGKVGHNRRLGFIGRRAMHMFLALFLSRLPASALSSSSPPASSTSTPSSDPYSTLLTSDNLDSLLETRVLGDAVGRSLKLEEVMRWTPAVSDGQTGPRETGLFKIRGAAVEAFVGAFYHQHGAAAARAFFQSRVLPHLSLGKGRPHSELAEAIEAEVTEGHEFLEKLPITVVNVFATKTVGIDPVTRVIVDPEAQIRRQARLDAKASASRMPGTPLEPEFESEDVPNVKRTASSARAATVGGGEQARRAAAVGNL